MSVSIEADWTSSVAPPPVTAKRDTPLHKELHARADAMEALIARSEAEIEAALKRVAVQRTRVDREASAVETKIAELEAQLETIRERQGNLAVQRGSLLKVPEFASARLDVEGMRRSAEEGRAAPTREERVVALCETVLAHCAGIK